MSDVHHKSAFAVGRLAMKCCLSALLLSLQLSASAQSPGLATGDTVQPIAETESTRHRDGFGGSLVVTTDEDWKAKWETPPENAPNFNRANVVPYGKKVFALSFFSNPKLDAAGNANVRCDLKMLSPAGQVVYTQMDQSCYAGKIAGDPRMVYLSFPVVIFSADPGDPAGAWTVEAVLRDMVRNTELVLRASFVVK